eukprot:4543779-Pyramimonas_sp.AAC.1
MFSSSSLSLSRRMRSSTVPGHSRQQWQRSWFGLIKNWWKLCQRRSSLLRRAISIWITSKVTTKRRWKSSWHLQ